MSTAKEVERATKVDWASPSAFERQSHWELMDTTGKWVQLDRDMEAGVSREVWTQVAWW